MEILKESEIFLRKEFFPYFEGIKSLDEVKKITNKDIAEQLDGLPQEKMHCSVMGKEALEAAIHNYRTGEENVVQLHEEIVCTCFGVSREEIERVTRENNLHTVDEVTNYCKAGGACGSCLGEIQRIIDDMWLLEGLKKC